ncbi:MAG: hypothetical protein KC713_03590, partial [Candidatus Omnitrophica bacterium]|nr:hypothetical protein [Candidatus Omnitrophota bacterium]
RHHHARLVEYARWVERKAPPQSIVITTDERIFFSYFTELKAIGRPCLTTPDCKEDLQAFQKKLDDYLENGYSVFITWPGMYAGDIHRQYQNFILSQYDVYLSGAHLYEDWHAGELDLQIYHFPLFQLTPKS